MRTAAALIVALVLTGCVSPVEREPLVMDVIASATLEQDKRDCAAAALAYHEPLSASRIGTSAVKGASSNAAGAAVNPVVPVLGAAGAALGTTLDQLGVTTDRQRRVFLKCLDHRGAKSGAYSVVDPEL